MKNSYTEGLGGLKGALLINSSLGIFSIQSCTIDVNERDQMKMK